MGTCFKIKYKTANNNNANESEVYMTVFDSSETVNAIEQFHLEMGDEYDIVDIERV